MCNPVAMPPVSLPVNVLAVARQHLGSLDHVTRIVRLVVSIATAADFRDHPKIADGASELLHDIFGKERKASLPLGAPVELEVTFEVHDLSPAVAARSHLNVWHRINRCPTHVIWRGL